MNNFNTLTSSDQLNGKIPQLPNVACLPDGIGSKACPWLDEYVEFSRKWSPESFDGYHEGCGLFVLSTTAARRVVYDLGGVHATNLYIGLIGNTGIHSKSTAALIGIDLLQTAGLWWFLASDESTPQKLIEDMSSTSLPNNFKDLDEENKEIEILRTLTAGQRGWFIDEFDDHISAMMRPESVMFGIKGLIRTLDGAPKQYKYSTISRGDNLLKNPYLSILGNITRAGLTPNVKKGTILWGDGYLARFALITPPASSMNFGKFPNERRIFPQILVSSLVDWHKRLGLPTYKIAESDGKQLIKFAPLSPHLLTLSGEAYEAFYRYHNALRVLIVDKIPEDLAGNYARFPEKALRIAAIFASFGNSDLIELKHWAKAQSITERWRVGVHELYHQATGNNGEPKRMFINSLPIEDQVLRAISRKVMPSKREINSFTGLKNDIIEPALKKLIAERKILPVPGKDTDRFTLAE